jgi:hypothetical protein
VHAENTNATNTPMRAVRLERFGIWEKDWGRITISQSRQSMSAVRSPTVRSIYSRGNNVVEQRPSKLPDAHCVRPGRNAGIRTAPPTSSGVHDRDT